MPTRWYLRNVTASPTPTAGEKSTALPVGTFQGNSGAGFEDRKLLTNIGSIQVSKALDSLAQTTHQDSYLARFTSDALAAQTIAAQTWTLAVATAEVNTNANSFTIASVYIWRPSNSTVVGFIYDSDAALGIEWGISEDGQVLSLTGSAVTILANDVLVLEFWKHAVQAMAAAYTQTLYFEGGTAVVDATVADAASYLEAANVITFASTTTAKAVGGATVTPTGILIKRTSKRAGLATLTPTGALAKVRLFTKAVGLAVMTPAGVILRKASKFPGKAILTPSAVIFRKASKFPGKAILTPGGAVIKKTSKFPGKATLTPSSTLARAKLKLKAVGGAVLTAIGAVVRRVSKFPGKATVTPSGVGVGLKVGRPGMGLTYCAVTMYANSVSSIRQSLNRVTLLTRTPNNIEVTSVA